MIDCDKVTRAKARKFLVSTLRHWPHVNALDTTPAPSGWRWFRNGGHAALVREGATCTKADMIRCQDWSKDRNAHDWPRPTPPSFTGIDWASAGQPARHSIDYASAESAIDRLVTRFLAKHPEAALSLETTPAAVAESHYVEGYRGKTAGHRADQGGLRAHSCGELFPFRIVGHPNDEWSAVAPDGSLIVRTNNQRAAITAAEVARVAWTYGCPASRLFKVVRAAGLEGAIYE